MKNCPFCNNTPTVEQLRLSDFNNKMGYVISCSAANHFVEVCELTLEKATEIWDKRSE
jgi:hypothetical protein